MALGAAMLGLSIFSSFITSPLQIFLPAVSGLRRNNYLIGVRRFGSLLSIASALCVSLASGLVAVHFDYSSPISLAVGVAVCSLGMCLHDWRRRLWLTEFNASRAFYADLVTGMLRFGLLGTMWATGLVSVGSVLFCYGLGMVGVMFYSGLAGCPLFGRRGYSRPRNSAAVVGVRKHLREGRWLFLNTLNFWSGAQLAIYLLGLFFGAAVVGAVNAAKNLFGLLNIVFLAMEQGLPQVLSRDRGRAGSLVRSISLYGGMATLMVIILVVTASPWLIPLLFGGGFADAVPFAVWWGAYFLVGFFHRPLVQALRARGMAKQVFHATLLGTLTVGLCAGLLPMIFGIAGVMAALLISQVVILMRLWSSYAEAR